MSRNYANIATAIWRDADFRALNPGAQRTYLMLVSQPDISAAGVLSLTVKRWAAMAKGTTPASIRDDIAELAEAIYVVLDEDTEELLIRSFIKWDGGYGNRKRRPVIDRAVKEVESARLRAVLAVELAKVRGNPLPEGAETDRGDAFPQVDRLSDGDPDGDADAPPDGDADPVSASDGVVVTKEGVVRTSTHNPQPSTPSATGGASKPSPPRWVDSDLPSALDHPEPLRTIVESLKVTSPGASLDEARAVHGLIVAQHKPKGVGYYRAIAANGGFAAYLAEMREARHREAERLLRELRRTEPPCEHDEPAGRALHPTLKTPLCPKCRRGMPSGDQSASRTAPEVQVVVTAYREGNTASGRTLETPQLVLVTRQATALIGEGVPFEDLSVVAKAAGADGVDLHTYATRTVERTAA